MTLKKHDGSKFQGPANLSPYPTSRLSASISLVDTARAIEEASEVIAHRTNAQLETVVEQMRMLQDEARRILDKAQLDMELHQAQCRFMKVPGKIYHLYQASNGHHYFSMLAPAEYHRGAPDQFVGSFRYEADQSWTPAEQIVARDQKRREQQAFLGEQWLGQRRLKE